MLMSDTKTIDISHIQFHSAVFPTDEDMALWNSLSAAEQFAIIERSEEAGFQSGKAQTECLKERLARVRAAYTNAL